jgi:lycopene cyclase domain-containing protein
VTGAYLFALLVALGGVGALDARLRLALWRAPRAWLAGVGAGVVLFLAWDAVALAAGFYSRGSGAALLGVDVVPRLPVEEVVFVTFLSYLAAVLHALAERAVDRLRAPTGRRTPRRRGADDRAGAGR